MAALGLVEVASALPWRRTRLKRGSPLYLVSFSSSPADCRVSLKVRRRRRDVRVAQAGDDDFYDDADDGFDDQIESTLDMLDEGADRLSEEFLTYGLPRDSAPVTGMTGMDTGDRFLKPESEVPAGTVVSYKIDEDEFHKISLHECDFFIRKVPDPDDNVYDFREMYVTPPDTDVYSIPKVIGKMPKQRTRCSLSTWDKIVLVLNNDKNKPREPMGRNEFHPQKAILIKHYKNWRALSERALEANYFLNFEKVYVIDGRARSIKKVKVKSDVPVDKNRDRSKEILTVRDKGTTFRIIPMEQRKSPDDIISEYEWNKSRVQIENYLRGFRDFEISNWF